MTTNFLTKLQWRRALKTFSAGSVNIDPILQAVTLAPSSYGLQPYHVHVVSDVETKQKLRAVSFDQQQVTDCSHLLVFTARTDAADVVERFIGALKLEGDPFAKELRDGVGKMTPEQFTNYASNQAFLALGFALAAAADLQLGSCPMGGFDADGVKNVLALPSNETTVALMAVGLPSDSKKAVPFPKFRFPVDVVCVKR